MVRDYGEYIKVLSEIFGGLGVYQDRKEFD